MTKNKRRCYSVKMSNLGACNVLTGNSNAAILLYRIIHLSEKKTMETNYRGKKSTGWIARSRSEWLTDTGLTRHQHDKAIKTLKERKLIFTQIRKMRNGERENYSFIKMRPYVHSAIEELRNVQQNSMVAELKKYCDSESAGSIKSEKTVRAENLRRMIETINAEKDQNVVIKETTKLSTYCDSKKTLGGKKRAKENAFEKNIKDIFYDGDFAHPIDNKNNRNLLSKMIIYLSDKKIVVKEDGYDPAVAALRYVVENWLEFIEYIQINHSGYNIPQSPTFFFIEKHMTAIPSFIKFSLFLKRAKEFLQKEGLPDKFDDDFFRFHYREYWACRNAKEKTDFLIKLFGESKSKWKMRKASDIFR